MLYNNINADAAYPQTTLVMNPASKILIDLFSADAGTTPGPPSERRPCHSTCPSSSPRR
jgi:hypothetical protein